MSAAVPPVLPDLRTVPDPRHACGRRHPLDAMLAVAGAAMRAGGASLLTIAQWERGPHAGAPVARRLGGTQERTPCVATLHRVFRRFVVTAFARAGGRSAEQVVAAVAPGSPPVGVASDGKTLRDRRQPTVPTVPTVPAGQLPGALGPDRGVVLAQLPVSPETDEARMLPMPRTALVLAGRGLTLAAAVPERPAAEAIVTQGGPTCWWSMRTSRSCWRNGSSCALLRRWERRLAPPRAAAA